MLELKVGDIVVSPNGILCRVLDPNWTIGEVTKIRIENINNNKERFAFLLKDLILLSEEEKSQMKFTSWVSSYEHSDKMNKYIRYLKEAGSAGIINDCGCPQNEYDNYTCKCRTMVKVYHRFSVFKDILVNQFNWNIIDVEMENGKHKTILIKEGGLVAKTVAT
jgi:hypothetical protein